MITKIVAGTEELALVGRWDTEESAPTDGPRTIRLTGRITGSGTTPRAMLRTARAELMEAAKLCSHSGGRVELCSYIGEAEIRMPARYLGMKQGADRSIAQAGCSVELDFRCVSRYWQGAMVSATASLAPGSCQLVMANGGTARARPAVIIRASSSYTGAVTLRLDDSRSVTWTGTIYTNQGLVFDMAARQVYIASDLPVASYPSCPGASSLSTAKVTDYDEWLNTVWDMDTDEAATVTVNPTSAYLTAELVHIDEYY